MESLLIRAQINHLDIRVELRHVTPFVEWAQIKSDGNGVFWVAQFTWQFTVDKNETYKNIPLPTKFDNLIKRK